MAGNSSGTTTSSSFVTALGIFGSGHCFNTPGSKQTCKTCIGLAQTPLRTFVHEEMSDEKDRLMEGTLLVWPTRHSWNKRKVLSV